MALNRDFLQKNSIWFPSAGKRDQALLAGQISAGNAQPLTNALNNGNVGKGNNILAEHLIEAQKRKCQKVLLSNELLLLALSQENKIGEFQKLIQVAGFAKVSYLLIIRDPVDQALSLYKHRAKAGDAPDIEKWPSNHYYYGTGLKKFLEQAKANNISLTCCKYNKQGNSLENACFREWLGLPPDELRRPQKRVNPSLSISELLLIRQVQKEDPILTKPLYDLLLHLPKEQKGLEPRIEAYYRAILSNELTQYLDTWNMCNEHLPADTPLAIPKKQTIIPDKVMTFTEEQGVVIAHLMHRLRSPYFLMYLAFIKYKRKLGRLLNLALRK